MATKIKPAPEAEAAPTAPVLGERLCEWLVAGQRTPAQALDQARALARETGEDLARLLLRLGTVSDRDVAEGIGAITGIPVAGSDAYPETPLAIGNVSVKFLRDNYVLPLAIRDGQVAIALAFPHDRFVSDALHMAFGMPVAPLVGIASEIHNHIERLYQAPAAELESIRTDLVSEADSAGDIAHLRDLASEAPVVRFVNYLLNRAVDARASDIHLEPFEFGMRVRYRVDGVLQLADHPPPDSVAPVISRIKLLAGLDIAERRLPQDGRIVMRVQGKSLDMRVSCVPTVHGETVVVRLLDKAAVPLDFEALAFDPRIIRAIRACESTAHGIFLVTGPTGSGKTTTLYTVLTELNEVARKIITVEDPVEYQLEGINQIQVKAGIDLTFANALRSVLRQDPDVIMIGEMRDTETARIAVQSALTGHLVLSTLHTNDAAGSVTRLLDMGIEPYLVTSTLIGVLAQRLVRRVCAACREPYAPLAGVLARLPAEIDPAAAHFYRARGCPACNHTGYQGRAAIAEYMGMDDGLRQLVLQCADSTAIERRAVDSGMRTMAGDGYAKAAAGLTSLEEVFRVTERAAA